jgi:hypothetical protein
MYRSCRAKFETIPKAIAQDLGTPKVCWTITPESPFIENNALKWSAKRPFECEDKNHIKLYLKGFVPENTA